MSIIEQFIKQNQMANEILHPDNISYYMNQEGVIISSSSLASSTFNIIENTHINTSSMLIKEDELQIELKKLKLLKSGLSLELWHDNEPQMYLWQKKILTPYVDNNQHFYYSELVYKENFISKYTSKDYDYFKEKYKLIHKLNYKQFNFTAIELSIINLVSLGYCTNTVSDILKLNINTLKKYLYANIKNKLLEYTDDNELDSDDFKMILRYINTKMPISNTFLNRSIYII